jgi:hypothetical protein
LTIAIIRWLWPIDTTVGHEAIVAWLHLYQLSLTFFASTIQSVYYVPELLPRGTENLLFTAFHSLENLDVTIALFSCLLPCARKCWGLNLTWSWGVCVHMFYVLHFFNNLTGTDFGLSPNFCIILKTIKISCLRKKVCNYKFK